MEIIGHIFKHKVCKGMTCKVLDVCVNGNYKVQQTETFVGSRKKPKVKTCYYPSIYWEDGTWIALD